MISKPVVDDYRATPYLICRNAATALEWEENVPGVFSDRVTCRNCWPAVARPCRRNGDLPGWSRRKFHSADS